MPVRMWPQSLFGRLLAASVAAVLLAQAMALVLIAQERELVRFVERRRQRDRRRSRLRSRADLDAIAGAERRAQLLVESVVEVARQRQPQEAARVRVAWRRVCGRAQVPHVGWMHCRR